MEPLTVRVERVDGTKVGIGLAPETMERLGVKPTGMVTVQGPGRTYTADVWTSDEIAIAPDGVVISSALHQVFRWKPGDTLDILQVNREGPISYEPFRKP